MLVPFADLVVTGCRCSDKSVVSTLEAINLVLGGGKFLVVVGMDKNIVGDAIQKEQKYTDKEKASDYLAKIVQVLCMLIALCCTQCALQKSIVVYICYIGFGKSPLLGHLCGTLLRHM